MSDNGNTAPNPDEAAVNGHKNSPQTSEQRNDSKLLCARCASVILLAGKGAPTTCPTSLPRVTQQKTDLQDATKSIQCDQLDDFICVDDMFDFENVGFTNSVDNIKYLTCADCEVGPIGYQDPTNKRCYVAVDRVKMESKS